MALSSIPHGKFYPLWFSQRVGLLCILFYSYQTNYIFYRIKTFTGLPDWQNLDSNCEVFCLFKMNLPELWILCKIFVKYCELYCGWILWFVHWISITVQYNQWCINWFNFEQNDSIQNTMIQFWTPKWKSPMIWDFISQFWPLTKAIKILSHFFLDVLVN